MRSKKTAGEKRSKSKNGEDRATRDSNNNAAVSAAALGEHPADTNAGAHSVVMDQIRLYMEARKRAVQRGTKTPRLSSTLRQALKTKPECGTVTEYFVSEFKRFLDLKESNFEFWQLQLSLSDCDDSPVHLTRYIEHALLELEAAVLFRAHEASARSLGRIYAKIVRSVHRLNRPSQARMIERPKDDDEDDSDEWPHMAELMKASKPFKESFKQEVLAYRRSGWASEAARLLAAYCEVRRWKQDESIQELRTWKDAQCDGFSVLHSRPSLQRWVEGTPWCNIWTPLCFTRFAQPFKCTDPTAIEDFRHRWTRLWTDDRLLALRDYRPPTTERQLNEAWKALYYPLAKTIPAPSDHESCAKRHTVGANIKKALRVHLGLSEEKRY